MKISVFIATSLDGFIARENGALDWLPGARENEALDWLPSDTPDEDYGYNDFFSSVDTMLMGRKSFEAVQGFSPFPYEGKRVVVCSRTLKEVPAELVGKLEIRSEPLPTLIKQLESDGVQHIYADGGQIITALLEVGLVDQLILTRVPVLLGSGIPLFGRLGADVKLKHIQTKVFNSGLVQSHYLR